MLLDRILGHELKDLDASVLPDPVDSVGSLILFGRIPPAVVVDDDGCNGEIDPYAGGKKGSNENLAAGILAELPELFVPVAGRSFDRSESDPFFSAIGLNDEEHVEILREDDDFLPAVQRFGQ